MDYGKVLDTRELQKRLEELESRDGVSLDDDEVEELSELCSLRDQVYEPHWVNGTVLILDAFFPEYAEEFSYDTGDLSSDSFLASFIDWDKVAESMQQDYMKVTFMGDDYWYRS